MIRLTLLRGIGLFDEAGHSIDRVVQQPKRLAVLAYLALVGRGAGCQRDTLFALFWPEMTARRARQALNATTHFLRQQLGQEIIENRGPDALGIAPGTLWCDAAEFIDTVAGDPEGALRLYSGDLLPGFYIGAGHEFERWLDEQRRHLRGLAADAARQLAERAAANHDMPGTIRLARRLIDLADNDEVLVRQAIALMGNADDRSGALDLYSRFASRLSEEYPGASPSPETLAIVDWIRSHEVVSERCDDSVARVSSDATSAGRTAARSTAADEVHRVGAALPVADSDPASYRPERVFPTWLTGAGANRWAIGLVSGATLATALLLTAAARSPRRARQTTAALPRVEIAGFTVLDHNPASSRFAAVLAEDVARRLTQATSLEVVEPLDHPGHIDGPGHDSPADLVARGSVAHSGGRLVIGLELVDGREGTTVRTARFESSDGLPGTADTLPSRIAQLVQETLRRQIRLRRIRESLHDERMYRLVQDVEEDRARADILRGQGQPQAAMRALANADTTFVTVERAVPSNGDVRTARSRLLASLAVSYFLPPTADSVKLRRTLTQAVAEADTAMLLDTANVDAAEEFANAGEMLVTLVRLPADSDARVSARVERALHRAIAIDPLRPGAWTQLSRLMYARGDFAGAYDAAHHAYDTDALDEHGRELLVRLSSSAYELGDDSASANWCTEMVRKYPHEWTSASCELSIVARIHRATPSTIEEAWQLAREASHAPRADPLMEPRVDMLVAATLAHAGLRDSAEHVIARASASAAADPEVLPFEAEARTVLGERNEADALIRRFVALAPVHRAGLLRSRRFRPH